MHIPAYKRLLSYLYPQILKVGRSKYNPRLELSFYKNQYQLATEDALYSDGDRYAPLKLAFSHLQDKMPQVKNMQVLGAGLGSAASVADSMGFHPDITLIDRDPLIVEWSNEIWSDKNQHVHFICADAVDYIQHTQEHYDMLVVDIFNSRVVPPFATQTEFLQNCLRILNRGGSFVLNYMVNDEVEWLQVQKQILSVIPNAEILSNGLNRIFTAIV